MEVNINNYNGDIEKTAKALRANNMEVITLKTGEEALEWVKNKMPLGSKVAIGGSNTLRETKITDWIEDEGHYQYTQRYYPHVPFKINFSLGMDVMNQSYMDAYDADFYLMSTNAVTEDGMLVNVDGMGNRVSALAWGPKKVIIVIGKNKIVKDMNAAFERLGKIIPYKMGEQRDINTPCRKTGYCVQCKNPGRACSQYLITAYQKPPREGCEPRITILLVDEELGF